MSMQSVYPKAISVLCSLALAYQPLIATPIISLHHASEQNITTYHYDAFSRLSKTTLPNGIDTAYHYDEYNALTRMEHTPYSKHDAIIQFAYYYHKDGSIRERVRSNHLGQQAIEHYQYDANHNLKDYACSGMLCPHDAQGQALAYQHYTFDAFNNIKTVSSNQTTTTYDYDQAYPTRLLRYHNSNPDYPGSGTLVYDHNGNITKDDQGNLITYDALDETQSVTTKKGTSTYIYNGMGTQVGERLSGKAMTYFIYGQAGLLNTQENTDLVSFLYGINRLGQQDQHGMQYDLTDQGQSVVVTVRPNAKHPMIKRYAYSPYGIESELNYEGGTNQPTQHFGFDGQLTDSYTHWQFLGHGYRAYNPMLHRFMHQDSLSPFDKGGLNGYVFGNNNPIMIQDPSGHFGMLILYAGLAIATIAMSIKNLLTSNNSETKWASLVSGMLAPFFCVTGASLEGAEFFGEILEGVSTGASMEFGQISGKEHKQMLAQMDAGDWIGLGFAGVTGVVSGFMLGEALESFKDAGYYGGAKVADEYVTEKSTWMALSAAEKNSATTWSTANLLQGSIRSAIINGASNMLYSSALNLYNKFAKKDDISTETLGVNALEDFGFGFIMGAIQPISYHFQNDFSASIHWQNFGYFLSGAVNGVLPYTLSFVQGML